ncbi:MAG: DUF2207 domain-containing protein [Gammaproteobacteria bacterium]|nr:DUF2207 domain-containing protein [Gammaproteobacteria bacterium]
MISLRTAALALVAWLGLAAVQDVAAQERILSFHSDIELAHDGSLLVTETIVVRAEGRRIRRGIYRDFPTRYRDRHGNNVVVDFELLDVQRDGITEPSFIERIGNGVRINTGDDSFLPVPADISFRIRYRSNRQLGFFADHDELYWNVTGNGWDFTIEQASAEVRLPEPIDPARIRLSNYTGIFGGRGTAARGEIPQAGVANFVTTEPLMPREGLTIVVEFPKGIVTEPARSERVRWFLRDNAGALAGLIGVLAVLAFYLRRWWRYGRGPAAGTIIPRYDPPPGYAPSGLRYLRRGSPDSQGFAADMVELAVRGLVIIHRDRERGQTRWRLARTDLPAPEDLPPPQAALLDTLFADRSEVELEAKNASLINRARLRQHRALGTRYNRQYVVHNGGTLLMGVVLSLVVFGIARGVHDGGVLVPLLLGVSLVVINLVFANAMRAPTAAGRRLLDHIEGLVLYLSVAERDELKSLHGPAADGTPPALDAQRYEALLPYAMALSVEDAWTRKFTAAVGAAAAASAAAGIAWYRGSGARLSSLGDVSSQLGRSLGTQISASASPPGSSSGGGGGGSSGGGGGGGGGGGR